MNPNIIIKPGDLGVIRVGHTDTEVCLDLGQGRGIARMAYRDAIRLARNLIAEAHKVERKQKALLPTKQDVSRLEERLTCNLRVKPSKIGFGQLAGGPGYDL